MAQKGKAGREETDDKLREYASKRDFARTPEPSGAGTAGEAGPLFVVHRHEARSSHYDLRFEVDGVLASFAVPKGPSMDPGQKRLAVRTEDHPRDYLDFEGVIPRGEYGAGPMIVWDRGRLVNRSAKRGRRLTLARALEEGHVRVRLEGQKLRGGFSLVRARLGGKDENWLLVKESDDEADPARDPVRDEPGSVVSGRTVEELRESG